MKDLSGEIKYLGWIIYKWRPGTYGAWYPGGQNSGRQYTSITKAKAHIKTIEEKIKNGAT